MKKNLPIYLYSFVIIFEGIFLLFSTHWTFEIIKYSLGIMLIIGGTLGFMKALSRQRKHVEYSYHELHALAMFVYGFSILLFARSIEIITYLTAFLFLFYAFSEILFCSWIFNLDRKMKYKIVLIRILLGLSVGVGTMINMHYNDDNISLVMQGFGFLFIIIGINVMLYVPIMKTDE